MSLVGRIALVTGGSRGIGLGIAQHLASLGMRVAINARSAAADDVAEAMHASGADVIGVVADVSRKSEVQSMVHMVERELGPIWLLVNNAGILRTGPVLDVPEDDWDQIMAVDAKGVFLCSQAVLEHMIPRRRGRIINISSIADQIVRTGQIAYCASKAAVNHLTRCLAVEVAEHGITVNALMPGATRTEMLESSFAERGIETAELVALIPDRRMAEPSDHAALVAFFASDSAQHVTGQVVSVDGGQSLLMPLPKLRVLS